MFIKNKEKFIDLEKYTFDLESELQQLLYEHPEIVINNPDFEMENSQIALKFREFSTSRGPVDVLYISKDADIILIETKLIKNAESIRTVLAQVIDYVRAITVDGYEHILNQNKNKYYSIEKDFVIDDKFKSILNKNVVKGNINIIIIGDDIHPNLLGLVETVQSAPHLAFHINLAKIETFKYNDDIIINLKNVENTKEIERSVINITFGENTNKPLISSETPSKTGQGSKPILSWEEYIDSIDEKYRNTINKCKLLWIKEFGESINLGTVGFTCGYFVGNKRYAPLWVYGDSLELITEKKVKKENVPENIFSKYKEILERSPDVFDKLMSGKTKIYFNDISLESLENIFIATIEYTKLLKRKYEE